MKSITRILVFTWAVAALCPAGPVPEPSNPLLGKWRVVSMGGLKLPKTVLLYWQFDDRTRTVTLGRGELVGTGQYTRSSLRDRTQVVTIKNDEMFRSVHVGIYEVKDGMLRLQLTIGTGVPPKAWDEDNVMLLEPVPSK